jgi:hypothetical protein
MIPFKRSAFLLRMNDFSDDTLLSRVQIAFHAAFEVTHFEGMKWIEIGCQRLGMVMGICGHEERMASKI